MRLMKWGCRACRGPEEKDRGVGEREGEREGGGESERERAGRGRGFKGSLGAGARAGFSGS